jgi:serine/threonine protein kinase
MNFLQAPEVLTGKFYTEKSDVFSLGIILHEVLFRIHPAYPSSTFSSGVEKFVSFVLVGLRPDFPAGTPRAMKEFLNRTWCAEHETRFRVSEVAEQLEKLFPSAT